MADGLKHRLKLAFPRLYGNYRHSSIAPLLSRVRTAVYTSYFKLLPRVASVVREYRQGSTKVHRSSFGLDLVGPAYLIDSTFECEELSLAKQHIGNIDVFVDVGTNIGLYSCLAASMGRRVLSVEPLPSNLRYLYENIRMNHLSGIEVFPLGLAASPGLLLLKGIGAQASFLTDWAHQSARFNKYVTTPCPVTTLDTVVGNRFHGQRLFIKIDVEGFEYEVLKGAHATLEMSPRPTWMIECFLENYHPGGRNPYFQQTFALFFEHGYTATVASFQARDVTRETVSKWVSQGFVDNDVYNFVFTHESARGSVGGGR